MFSLLLKLLISDFIYKTLMGEEQTVVSQNQNSRVRVIRTFIIKKYVYKWATLGTDKSCCHT